jgi:PhoPQ-activated pathogenicity-related protein
MARALLLAAALIAVAAATPLDDYMNNGDKSFSYKDTGVTLGGNGWTAYIYNMTSQTWMTEAESSQPVWWHHVAIVIPHAVDASKQAAFMYITGGDNKHPMDFPKADDEGLMIVAGMSVKARTAGAVLWQVPNQPIKFPCDPYHKSRSEDAAIALTWWKFMQNTSNPDFILELPMTKAGVRGLDLVEQVVPKYTGTPVTKFIVAGASKRGWTTWLVGAVDKRVTAIVPIVLDALHVVDFFHRQWKMYGAWTFALTDYYAMNITRDVDSPAFATMMKIIDPYYYLPRLTMPKLVLNAVGDEFQMPDDQRHWGHDAVGETNFVMVKNAEHSMATGIGIIMQAAGAFSQALTTGNYARPAYTWSHNETNGDIIVTTTTAPKQVTIQYADSAEGVSKGRRDFRWAAINVSFCPIKVFGGCVRPIIWKTTDKVEKIGPNSYRAHFDAPKQGWRSFLISLQWDNPTGPDDFLFTSPASVVPTTYPFPDCHGDGCYGTLV